MRLSEFCLGILYLCGVAAAQPVVAGCPVFPVTNIWNVSVKSLSVDRQSAAYVASIGPKATLRIDTTMPISIVTAATPMAPLQITSPAESDPGGYPIPDDVKIEAGSDGHAVIVDKDRCLLYELYNLKGRPGEWRAGATARWDLRSNALRPFGWTSADAAGLPILPGILRYEEMVSGHIDHALRFTAPTTRANVFAWPGRHYASHSGDPKLPMMGQRFRLRASVDISGFSPHMQVILRALQKYGIMLADNGLPWFLQASPDPRWDADELNTLRQITGSDWEAVDVSSLMSDPDSGLAVFPPPTGVVVTDLLGRKTAVPLGPGLSIRNGALTVLK